MKTIYFAPGLKPVVKFNPNHDDKTGEFSSGITGGAAALTDISSSLAKVFGKHRKDSFDILPKTQAIIEEMFKADLNAGKGQGDYQLEIIAHKQGFDGKPKVVDTMEELQASGTVVYRGLGDFSRPAENGMSDSRGKPINDVTFTAHQAFEDFKSGDYHGGGGYFGSGTYTTHNVDIASEYATGTGGSGNKGNGLVMAMSIPRDARMPTQEVVNRLTGGHEQLTFQGQENIGRALAAKGYQAYNAGLMQKDKMDVIVVLDRSMLTVLSTPHEDYAVKKSLNEDVALSRYGGKALLSFTPSQMQDYYDYLSRGGTAEQFFSSVIKYNMVHDTKTGQFASGDGKVATPLNENILTMSYIKNDFKLSSKEFSKISFYIQKGIELNNDIRNMVLEPNVEDMALKEIDNAINRAPKQPNKEVWRVTSADSLIGLKKGDVISDRAYQSTTIADLTHPDNGILLLSLGTVSKGQKALVKINTGSVGTGLYLPAVSKDPVSAHEQEFLMPRGTKMEYQGSTPLKLKSGSTMEIHNFKVVP